MKSLFITLIILAMILLAGISILNAFRVDYDYNNSIGSFWSLADKASTIEQKSQYIDKFVEAVRLARLDGQHNAVIFQTPDNGFDQNFLALTSFQSRLHEIKDMDIKSFEYQTAIQQITSQEQGEAGEMLSVIRGCWVKEHHPFYWDWWGVLFLVICVVLEFGGVVAIIAVADL